MKKTVYHLTGITAAALCLASACTPGYEEYPPRYERSSDYIIPSSEAPTDEERAEANAIIREYEDLYPVD